MLACETVVRHARQDQGQDSIVVVVGGTPSPPFMTLLTKGGPGEPPFKSTSIVEEVDAVVYNGFHR